MPVLASRVAVIRNERGTHQLLIYFEGYSGIQSSGHSGDRSCRVVGVLDGVDQGVVGAGVERFGVGEVLAESGDRAGAVGGG